MSREQIDEIDELTTVLYEANHKKSVLDYRWLATEAYNAGYRKQKEGEWKTEDTILRSENERRCGVMANRTTEHIIESLKSCISKKGSCDGCSYRQEKMCREMLKKDALHRLIQLETVRKTIKTNRKRGKWKIDKTHESKYKSVYICSICGHYQVVKKETEQIHYMNYCPFCGAECEVVKGGE